MSNVQETRDEVREARERIKAIRETTKRVWKFEDLTLVVALVSMDLTPSVDLTMEGWNRHDYAGPPACVLEPEKLRWVADRLEHWNAWLDGTVDDLDPSNVGGT